MSDNKAPLILPFAGVAPRFATPPTMAHPDAVVIGRSTIGARSHLAAFSVIRGDGNVITAGNDLYLGVGATLHIVTDQLPCIVGSRITVGDNACVHAVTLGDDIVVGNDAVILDGSTVGSNTILDAGAVVFPRTNLEGGFIYAGCPAKPVGPVPPDLLAARAAEVRSQSTTAWRPACTAPVQLDAERSAYVAAGVRLSGRIVLAARTSLWFGVAVDAGSGTVRIAANTNVQDNTRIVCTGAGATIGADTTVGHNVLIGDCTIGERCLIGIGSTVAPGTVIAPDILLAAGASTSPGQQLSESGIWAGTPARRIGNLDAGKRELIARIVAGYCDNGAVFAETPGASWSP